MGALYSSLASIDRSLSSIDRYLEIIDRCLASIQDFSASIQRALPQTKRPSYDLPPKILDIVVSGLPDPADRARARVVCRSWHAAVRRHGTQPWRLPSTMSVTRRLRSLPSDADTVGSTDDWLAIRVGKKRATEDGPGHHKYLLHNPFFNKTVPLTELDAVIGDHESIVYKFLMRSGADDLIAVITNNRRHAFMVILPGKGLWLPPPRTRPYIDIIDFAFLQGKLYAITEAEELIPFDLALDGEGRPLVTMGRRLIKKSPDYNGHHVAAAPNDISFANCSAQVTWSRDGLYITSRHLIESRGKLLMVRHRQQVRSESERKCCPGAAYITRQVEIFEANPNAGTWMTVTGGLGGSQSLFISINFSKSIAAPCREVEEDVIYFMDTGEVFNLKSGTSWPSRLCRSFGRTTWLFHPELMF